MSLKELHKAVDTGQQEKALELLENEQIRKNINSVIKCETILYKAANKNNKDIVSKLLSIPKIDINTGIIGVFGNYSSPLHVACKNGNVDIVNDLLEAKASWFKCDDKGMNPLHHAAKTGSADIVGKLLERQPNLLNERTTRFKDQPTALHISSEMGHVSVVKLLHQFGANMHVKTKVSKLTACDLAIAFKQQSVLVYFKEINLYDGELVMASNIGSNHLTHTPDGTDTEQEEHVARLTNELVDLQKNQMRIHSNIEDIHNVIETLVSGQKKTENELKEQKKKIRDINKNMEKLHKWAKQCGLEKTDDESDSSVDSTQMKQPWKKSISNKIAKAEKMKRNVQDNFEVLINQMNGDFYLNYLYSKRIISLEFLVRVKDYPYHTKNRDLLIQLLNMDAHQWVFELQKAFKNDQEYLANIFKK